ncbi:MAG: NAD(P)/FAD-dependent oxidoreductase [archaeon GB-1867-097]|nr:NAD(P)/FAD-dependent oxidoreductase [Candidatus Culexmicrobium thermophilum]MCS7384480.1 NAD(P)/FAD-dependent oxidoreductase [Candidatus Culexmicrobium thermophilum]
MKPDVIIIGAGPAGLFAAHELAYKSRLSILIIDQGKDVDQRICPAKQYSYCKKCTPCNIMSGVGGAGTLSSGLLNLRPDIGGNLIKLTGSEEEAWKLVNYVDSVFLKYGAPKKIYHADGEIVEELERKAAAAGAKFIPIPQRHIGSDKAPQIIKNFKRDLETKGVTFLLNTKVAHINRGSILLEDGRALEAEYIIAAPGRVGAEWLAQEARRLKIPTKHEPIDIGVRVEVPAVVMEPIIKVNRDPKFHIYTKTYDDFVRTFCVNHRGFVVQELYDNFVGVNGHSMVEKQSPNTNFAFLVRISLTEPIEDTTAYGQSITRIATILGGGKPIIQRLGDLRLGRRSTWRRITHSHVKPTLTSVTPGDIAMVLPHRILTDIIEGLDILDKIIPGVASSSTLLYAPEVKFSANKIETNKNLETPIPKLYVAGDGAGFSRGLVTAAATGIIVARSILKREGVVT